MFGNTSFTASLLSCLHYQSKVWAHFIYTYLPACLQPVLSSSRNGEQNTGGRWTTRTTKPSPEPSIHCSTLRRWRFFLKNSSVLIHRLIQAWMLCVMLGESLWCWRLWGPLFWGSHSETSGKLRFQQVSTGELVANQTKMTIVLCSPVTALWVEELSISGFAESNPEHHHRFRTSGRISALCTLGLSGQLTGTSQLNLFHLTMAGFNIKI